MCQRAATRRASTSRCAPNDPISPAILTLVLVGVASVGVPASTRRRRPASAAKTRQAQGRLRRQAGGMPGGRFEISGAAGMIGGTDLGTATATLSGSGVPTGTPVTLFDTETKIEGGPRYEARVAWRLTPALQVEGGVAINQTHLTTRITNDFEQAPNTEASETFTEYAIRGRPAVPPDEADVRGRPRAAVRHGRRRLSPPGPRGPDADRDRAERLRGRRPHVHAASGDAQGVHRGARIARRCPRQHPLGRIRALG